MVIFVFLFISSSFFCFFSFLNNLLVARANVLLFALHICLKLKPFVIFSYLFLVGFVYLSYCI